MPLTFLFFIILGNQRHGFILEYTLYILKLYFKISRDFIAMQDAESFDYANLY